MVQKPWNPESYARFGGLRLRPALDLMAQVGALPAGDVVDLGCGAGAAGPALAERFHDRRRIGVDISPDRAPIAPLTRLLPKLREAGVAVIWVNWGNRPDLANMPPNQIHLYKPRGQGIGLGDPLPTNGAPVLQKDSWAAAVVDELPQEPGDIKVDKYRISGFWDTPLDSILRNHGIRSILFAGVNTDQCVLHTLTDANFLGYGCILVEDCCGTTSPDFCTEATVWNVKKCFGFVTDTAAILHALSQRGGA